jgi:hypothetical protein
MTPLKNGIRLTVNRQGSPTPEMTPLKNGIRLTVKRQGSPTPEMTPPKERHQADRE